MTFSRLQGCVYPEFTSGLTVWEARWLGWRFGLVSSKACLLSVSWDSALSIPYGSNRIRWEGVIYGWHEFTSAQFQRLQSSNHASGPYSAFVSSCLMHPSAIDGKAKSMGTWQRGMNPFSPGTQWHLTHSSIYPQRQSAHSYLPTWLHRELGFQHMYQIRMIGFYFYVCLQYLWALISSSKEISHIGSLVSF